MLRAVRLPAAAVMLIVELALLVGHRSSVIGHMNQGSVLAFQHHKVDGVSRITQQAVKAATREDEQDFRVLQAEAEDEASPRHAEMREGSESRG